MATKKRTLKDTAKDDLAKFVQDKAEDKGNMKMLNIRIDGTLRKKVKMYCVKNEMSIQDFVTQAVKDKLKAA